MQPSGGVCVNPEGTADGVRVGADEVGPRAQLWGALPHENAPRTMRPSLGEEISSSLGLEAVEAVLEDFPGCGDVEGAHCASFSLKPLSRLRNK